MISRACQTPQKWNGQRNGSRQHQRNIVETSEYPTRDKHFRSTSPFAPYGLGDKELTIAGKRTFNVKADTDKVHTYA